MSRHKRRHRDDSSEEREVKSRSHMVSPERNREHKKREHNSRETEERSREHKKREHNSRETEEKIKEHKKREHNSRKTEERSREHKKTENSSRETEERSREQKKREYISRETEERDREHRKKEYHSMETEERNREYRKKEYISRGKDERNEHRRKEDIFTETEERNKDYRNKELVSRGGKENVSSDSVTTPAADMPTSKKKIETINMRTGGAYIPPAKLKMMQDQITDKGSLEYQKLAWEALKKSLTGLTNKINVSNLPEVVRELFMENLIRGRGVLARAIMQAQAASHTFTHVYAAFVAVINSKFPQIGELILKRLVLQFRKGFRRNDKPSAVAATRFIAHLFNQQVAHEIVVLEILILLLENPTYDSVEIAVAMLKECGQRLTQVSPRGVHSILDRLRSILHEKALDIRVQYMIEVMMAINKDKFKDHPAIQEGLDLVEEADRITHFVTLDEEIDGEDILNVFKFDPDYIQNEEKYKDISREILGGDESGDSSSGSDDDDDGESGSEDGEEKSKGGENQILDMTETNLVALRRNIYLTIQSSLDFEECAHKLLKMELNPGQIVEMCYMILDCCSQQRTYEKFFGLLAQRFCQLNNVYVEPFTDIFKNSYDTIHRVETNKLRNVAKFFAHLLYTDAISWMVLANIKLNKDDTTSSSRIFIKILFQELSEYMGLKKLNDRIKDGTLQEAFDGLFPRVNTRDTRFAINFFISIGLGGLTCLSKAKTKEQEKD